jgi:lysophospholipase L1-like esterase
MLKQFRPLLILISICWFSKVWSGEDNTIRILGVGNSFTVNSQKFLPEISANDPAIQVEIAGAIIGGSPLDKHVRLAKEHEADSLKGKAYTYNLNGKNLKKGASLKEILQDREWDVVTIQQVSTKSYKPETYSPYTGELIDYIRTYAPQAEILIHETWSHSVDSYRNTEWKLDPNDMYEKLHAAYAAISKEFNLRVIPVGTAFQNARATPMWEYQQTTMDVKSLSYSEDKDNLPDERKSLNRIFYWKKDKQGEWFVGNDGFHANQNGEYLGGLVWYACIFGKDPRKITYKPDALTEEQAVSLREIAYESVMKQTVE